MDYQDTWLTRPIRIGIMIFLFLCFFVTAPLTLLYTAGYRYDIWSKTVVQTGVLSIDAQPEDAAVRVNGILIQKSLPIRLSNRTPGAYTISISKDGYHTWEKTVDIKSKQTTYISDISLYKQVPPVDLTTNPIEHVSPLGRYALSVQQTGSSTYIIGVIDTKNATIVKEYTLESDLPPRTSWSDTVPYAFVESKQNDDISFLVIDAHRPDRSTVFNSTSTSTPQVQWSTSAQFPGVFISLDSELSLIRPQQRTPFGTVSSTLWYVDSNLRPIIYTAENRALTVDKNDPVVYPDNLTGILFYSDKGLIARTADGMAIYSRSGERRAALPTDKLIYDPVREEWIAWSHWEIWRITQDLDTVFLTRFGSPIAQVSPLENNGALLVHTAGQLIAFHPGFSTFHVLIDNTHTLLSVDQTQRLIYLKRDDGSMTPRQQVLNY